MMPKIRWVRPVSYTHLDVYKRQEQLIDKARRLCDSVIADCMFERVHEWTTVKNRLRDEVSHLMYHETKRSPMILSLIHI